jgi:hypothetical protein
MTSEINSAHHTMEVDYDCRISWNIGRGYTAIHPLVIMTRKGSPDC